MTEDPSNKPEPTPPRTQSSPLPSAPSPSTPSRLPRTLKWTFIVSALGSGISAFLAFRDQFPEVSAIAITLFYICAAATPLSLIGFLIARRRKIPSVHPIAESPSSQRARESKDSNEAKVEESLDLLDQEPNFEAEMGSDTPLPELDVDVILRPSRAVPIAGELWSVRGEIYNRSQFPIWIIDHTTRLTLPPEMYGQLVSTGSIAAFFPTIQSRFQSEVIRIDPGGNYFVTWKIDPIGNTDTSNSLVRRIEFAITNFAFFNPGAFQMSATIHIWSSKRPAFTSVGMLANQGDSFCKSVSQEISMEASPWVLILGAAAGGAWCFVLQLLIGPSSPLGSPNWISTVAVGIASSILLCSVVTVLLSRLAATDFLIAVRVKDIWGAVATGFAVQWFGYGVVAKLLAN